MFASSHNISTETPKPKDSAYVGKEGPMNRNETTTPFLFFDAK